MVVTYKNGRLFIYLFFLIRAPSMQQKNYILVVFKVYLGATMVSPRRHSGEISLLLCWPYTLNVCCQNWVTNTSTTFRTGGENLYPLMVHLNLLTPHSYLFILWQEDIYIIDWWSIYCSYFLLYVTA